MDGFYDDGFGSNYFGSNYSGSTYSGSTYSGSNQAVTWNVLWEPRSDDPQYVDDASSSSMPSSSDYSESPSAATIPLAPDGTTNPTYDYNYLAINQSALLEQVPPEKRSTLRIIIDTILRRNVPNQDDVNRLLDTRNGFSCAFHGCDDNRSGGLGDRRDKAREHVLIKHLTSHYACPYCTTITARLNDFKKHLKNKHGDATQFPCDICDRVLKSKHNLHRHLENVHSLQPSRRIRQY